MTGYQPDFDIDYRRGLVGEKLIGTFLENMAGSTIEVKTDYRAFITGNLYIETQQEIRGEWVPSGLAISKATFYCFAGPKGEGFLTIPTPRLKQLVVDTGRPVHMKRKSDTSRDTKGFLIRVEHVVGDILKGTNEYRGYGYGVAPQSDDRDSEAAASRNRESSGGRGSLAEHQHAVEIYGNLGAQSAAALERADNLWRVAD